ncbi:SDR family NAD(P)-dependent oxidoreductase [Saccharopolyspora sp. K220]|uniref:SDR family NAD(P)-dependent oxidoreductase n=1 Tax=Saccharopolyspora soli TaxID=2926618 RepID=UPI001F59635C|nr:SDR family NAD(P)-dependent oxidoreductase [Saccharopolyspora soli]MCI2422527.1 SDR family NAD(P)-dependent oxidoreductase [Saccharopolyspora soli]
MPKTILISGASSGFGALTARALADAGHTVYAGMRDIDRRNATQAEKAQRYAKDNQVELRPVELDVTSESSVDDTLWTVLSEQNRLDVLVHNAEHVVTGPAEAFTPEQLAALYDTSVLGAQRINRAALPHMRHVGDGLLVWIGGLSTCGGAPPYLAPFSATKAALAALAASYAPELARWGIETTIVVPGSLPHDTSHYAHVVSPDDDSVVADYEEHHAGLQAALGWGLTKIEPPDADVAEAIATVVDTPKGERPLRVHVDSADDRVTVADAVADRIRAKLLVRTGRDDLVHPRQPTPRIGHT